jgi:mono/diheme cytochrome c family protein
MLVIYLGFGVAIPALLLTGNDANANAQIGGIKLTAQEKRGRVLFGQYCAVCHTLAAANADALVGPNLDMIQPSSSLVLHTIENGCLPNPGKQTEETCLGYGVMPANVVQGSQARAVAAFVGAVAGKE